MRRAGVGGAPDVAPGAGAERQPHRAAPSQHSQLEAAAVLAAAQKPPKDTADANH